VLYSIEKTGESPHVRKNSQKLPEHAKTGGDQVIFKAIVKLRDTACIPGGIYPK
jgi:hypothetical protein